VALHANRTPSAVPLDRSLAAFELALAGSRAAAAESLAALELELADRRGAEEAGTAHPFLAGLDRLAAARWLSESGEPARAAALLRWCDAIPTIGYFEIIDATRILAGLAMFERARIEVAEGQLSSSREHFRRFLAEYDLPPPAHRWMVETARSALQAGDEP
jgi:hypothetical protein